MSITSTHFFCGGGGDTQGLKQAGFTPVLAANHDAASIATHQANFPDCEHLNTHLDERIEMRKLPRTDVLWASPICTETSPAGGRKRRPKKTQHDGQLAMFEDEKKKSKSQKDDYERTRVTALTIISATEAHRYDVVMGENVVEFGTDWELFDWWIQGMRILGYEHQLINVNAAHVGTETIMPAPQWRDRLFFIFWRKGINMPKLTPQPWAPCVPCGEVVQAYQWWKKPNTTIGKYRQQYLYRCPNVKCRHSIVEPYVRPASDIIDFSNLGTRIGDRKTPLVPNTMRRIEIGLEKFAGHQVMVTVNHGGHDGRPFIPCQQPFPVRSTKIGEGMVTPPLLVPAGGTWNDTAHPVTDPMRTVLTRDAEGVLTPAPFMNLFRSGRPRSIGVDEPLATLVTSGANHGLVSPPAFIAELRRNGTARSVTDPLTTITAGGNHHGLVVPYYSNGKASPVNRPLSTVTTVDRHGLVTGETVNIEDCYFRMVQPREQFLAQGFPPDYKLLGSKTQQTAQAGNAVPVNVAEWIGQHTLAVLAAS